MNTLTSILNTLKLSVEKELKMKNILDLLDESDYELDLKIAEVFEGENLFTIYLLMIHELTLGELKHVGFKKLACERIIKAIISSQNLEKPNYPILNIFKYFFELIKIIDIKIVSKALKKLKIEKYEILELINSDNLKLIDVRYFLARIFLIYNNGLRILNFGLMIMILEKDVKDNDTLSENSIGILTEIMRRNSRWFSSRFFIKVEGAKEYLKQFNNIINNQKVINWIESNTSFVKNNEPEHPLKYILEISAVSDKQLLEPTYLRYVYDGLSKGSISSNNAAGLPFGFIGLFEKEFQAHIPSDERSKLLRRLGVWALFKGAVSAEMSSTILDEHIDETKALIDRFTKWFNSPEPGKYVLYHDRLRTYLLQKLSDFEINELNEILIEFLENVLEKSDGSEAEFYALEYLSTHMAVESQLNNNYKRLNNFVNSEDLWPRQVKASKEYMWSQKGIHYGIMEGARRHYEINTLTSTVNSIKLTRVEQSNVKQILGYLKDGDYQTSLIRIESLPSNNKIQFIVYLLMIHELTIGECKNSDFNSEALKEILQKIKNNYLNPPHLHFNSITNSDKDSYSGYLVYVYYLEIKKRELECDVLFNKILWDGEDFLKIAQFNKVEVNQLIDSLDYLKDDKVYYKALLICYFFYHLEIEKTDNNKRPERSSDYFKKHIYTNNMYALFSFNKEFHWMETRQLPLSNPKNNKLFIFNKSLRTSKEKLYTYLKEIILIVYNDRNSYLFIDDNDKTDIVEQIFKIINIHNLNQWIKNEKLSDLIFKNFKIFCSKNPEFSAYYAIFLTREGKVKLALDFLSKIEDDYSIDNPYRYNYYGDDIKISFDGVRANLISYDFTNNFQLIINSISNEQIKSLAYLSFIYKLNEDYDDNQTKKHLIKIKGYLFNLDDLEQGRTTNFSEYEQNIYLSLLYMNLVMKLIPLEPVLVLECYL